MMKRFIILLFAVFTASAAFAQYPNAPNKMRLGAQTTGNGLIFRHAGEPSWTPTGINNAWLSIDTLTGDLYAYRDGNWFLEIKGDLQQVYPLVINKTGSPILRGQVVGVDTSQIIQGDQIRIMPAIGDGGLSSELIMGVAANDIANDASGYVAWFGYVREVDESDIAQTGITLNVGDILYLSATEPGRLTNVEPTPPALKTTIALVVRKPSANNMTLLVRPKLNEDLSDLNDVDLNGINNGQTIVWDSINTKWIAGDVGTTDVTSITAGVGLTGGTITSTGTIAADTAGVLVTKTFLTNQGYTTNTGTVTGTGANGRVSFWTGTNSQSGDDGLFWSNTNKWLGVGTTTPQAKLEVASTSGFSEVRSRTADSTSFAAFSVRNNNPSPFLSGIIRGSAHTGTLFGLPNANGAQLYSVATDYLVVGTFSSIPLVFGTNNAERMRILSGGNVGIGTTTPSVRLDVAGTDAIRIPTGTTAQRPGTPLVGMMRNNTTNNNLDFYTGTAWENPLKSATATGLGTAGRVFYADANGRAAGALVGSGLTLSNDTLRVTSPGGTTNLTFSGASSPVTLNSDTGTDVTFTAGDGISLTQATNNLTISRASPIYAVITVDSNRTSTFLAASVTPDTIDNPKLSQVGGVFSVVGNGIQYTSGTARTFLIMANADFKFSEANNVVKFQGWRSNGGTVIDLGTFGTVESLLGNEIMHTSFSAITSLSNNDLLRFGFTPGAHTGDDDLVLTNLSITITQL
jgi:hypothetical protein